VPAVSVVVAAYTLPYGLCQVFLGPFGDRAGKLRVMLGGLLAYALATGACALAGSLPVLTVLRVAAGAASAALIPVGMAYVADAVPYQDRQVVLSRFLNGVVLAQTLAGPLGGVFGQYLGWRGVFLLLAAGALVLSAALAQRIRRLPDRRDDKGGFSLSNYLALARHRFARRLLLWSVLDGMLLMGCFPFLAPYMRDRFGLSYAVIGLVLSAFGLGMLVYTRLVKWLVARLGEAGLVLAGSAAMAGAMVAGMASPRWEAFVPVEMLLGLGFYLLHGVMQARATEMLPHARATAVGSFAFMLFMGQSLGALCMGAAIARLGYQGAFLADAAAVLLLGIGLGRLMRRGVG
jgi:predicted MFS family arabinose efflux permease